MFLEALEMMAVAKANRYWSRCCDDLEAIHIRVRSFQFFDLSVNGLT